MQVCSKCDINKEYNCFNKNSKNSNEFSKVCKDCKSLSRKRTNIHIKDNLLLCLVCKTYKDSLEFDINSKNIHRLCKDRRCKNCKREQYEKRKNQRRTIDTLDKLFVERLCGARDRARKNNLEFTLTIPYLHYLWEKQRGLCAISNVSMTYKTFHGRVFTNVSIDRIDSLKGYTQDNVHLVCMVINQMKSDLTIDELIYFCKAILNTKLNEIKN